MNPHPAAAPGQAEAAPGERPEARPPIRLMIVDDSPIARAVLSRMLAAHKDLEVQALASNADEALDALQRIKLDIVLLDVEMPGTSGLDALPEILRRGDGARVLIVSSFCEEGAEAAVKALALGAADTLPKPGTGSFGGRFSDILAERLRRIGYADRAGQEPRAPEPAIAQAEHPLRTAPDAPLGCLALGASTGGIHALGEFLRALPPRIGAPILVTQHLPAVFIPVFARQIQIASGRVTRVAEEGLPLNDEEIILAPGDAHLRLKREGDVIQVALSRGPASTGCMPSVDPMFASVAETFGRNGVGIIFSGMGRDGYSGSSRIAEAGGAILVQDKRSSAVWGMPRAVVDAGLASHVLPPTELAERVAERARGAQWK